jgi:exopolyphosphatase/guanosine-5'-triphosphate,3'-diphosphate pyrophosphatase
MGGAQRIAVVDLGTNSTRLLVADVTAQGDLVEIDRQGEVTRLGQGVDSTGRLAEEAQERVFACLARYRELTDTHGAERAVAVATSAMRDADNGAEFQAAIEQRFGLEIRTISGEEEARLTFLGATAGRGTDSGPVLVIDIGGGSTEYVVGRPGEAPSFHVSTRMGSVRQTERHVNGDPPAHEEMEALAMAAREIVVDGVPAHVRKAVEAGIAVAGTATSLAAIDQQLEPYDPARVDGYRLLLGECERIVARLAAMPLEQRRAVPGLHPDRAPTIVAGAVILVESMRAFGLDFVEVSEADILHGVALDLPASG